MAIKTLYVFLSGEVPNIAQQLMGMKTTPRIERLINLIKPKFDRSGIAQWRGFGLGGFDVNYATVVIAKFEVDDFFEAEAVITKTVAGTEFEGQISTYHAVEDGRGVARPKTLTVRYDVASVGAAPLDFRNEAMVVIEAALEAAGAGEWFSAESGEREISFAFVVVDFEVAEKIVRDAVAGTRFEGIHEIARSKG